MMLKEGYKVGIVCCSNAQPASNQDRIRELLWTIQDIGLIPVSSPYLYEKEDVFGGDAKQRAEALMEFYRDEEVKAIFDISGGDIANQILPYLDYEVIKNSHKPFFGYSDVTTVINAIYAKTGQICGLYQVLNLCLNNRKSQREQFQKLLFSEKKELLDISYEYIQGRYMQGVVVGGNIRCFLKLAGTAFMPDVTGKILLLECFSGTIAQVSTYFAQLQQLGVFEKVNGVLLGTFTTLDAHKGPKVVEEIARQAVGDAVPIARTFQIGHGSDSKCIMIGSPLPASMK